MKKTIAFFDFDGTITKRDTLLEFIKFSKGNFFFLFGFLLYSPYLIAYKLKLISNHHAKEKMLTFFFKNMPLDDFQELCDRFADEVIPILTRHGALSEIEKLKKNNTIIVIVSASPENWIRKWADKMGLEVIATYLEVHDEKLTGRISGKNCHGVEKVNRIKAIYDLADFEKILVFGDSSGDRPMMALSTLDYFKPFR